MFSLTFSEILMNFFRKELQELYEYTKNKEHVTQTF